jgi:hypothetical protein
MKIKIRNKHFKKATWYSSKTSCPLAIALKNKKKLKDTKISVDATTVYINGNAYWISKNWCDVNEIAVDNKIHKAKNGKKVKKVLVELKPW